MHCQVFLYEVTKRGNEGMMKDLWFELKNSGMGIIVAAATLLAVLVCTVPARVSGDSSMNVPAGYMLAASDITADETEAKLDGYSLNVIIEDEAVPLSAGGIDYRGLVMPVVLASLLIAFATGYYIWYRNHRKRIASLLVMGLNGDVDIEGMDDVSILHPFRTIRFENELENRVVSSTAKGV